MRLIGKDADLLDLPTVKVSEARSAATSPPASRSCAIPTPGSVSVHRQQVKGRDKTGFLMLPRRYMRRIYDKYSARGLPTPVAVVIGVHPAMAGVGLHHQPRR